MKNNFKALIQAWQKSIAVFSTLVMVIMLFPQSASASNVIPYHGILRDSSGTAITTATNVNACLFTASSGGSSVYALLGSSGSTCPTATGSGSSLSVTPNSQGEFTVLIGDVSTNGCGTSVACNALPTSVDLTANDYYLEFVIGGSALSSRQQLGNALSASAVGPGYVRSTATNSAGGSANPVDVTSTLGIMDGSDTFNGVDINVTHANHTGSSNVVTGLDITASGSADAEATETAINIGGGWDADISLANGESIVNSTDGTVAFTDGTNNLLTIVDGGTTGNVTATGTLTSTGAFTATSTLAVGSDGSGTDATFYGTTSTNELLWDASADALLLDGVDGTTALNVTDGNVIIADKATITGTADGTDALVLTTGDILVSDGDVDLSGGDFNVTLDAADGVTIANAAATATTGIIDLNVTAGNAAVDAANIGLTVNDGATATTDFTGLEMLLTANDADADVFGLTITGAATANATTASYEAGLTIDNAEDTASSMTDAILITSSGAAGGVVDAIDVSASNITNALNVGGNNIQLFDSAINISSVDGQLDIDADTEVEITTTTLDLNGILDVSGALTIAEGALANDSIVSADIKDGEIVTADIATGGVATADILDNTVSATDLSATLSFADADYIDLSAIVHDDTALQGLRLPQIGASPSNPTSGEGQIGWDETNNTLEFYNGTSWAAVATTAPSLTAENTFTDNQIYTFTTDEDIAINATSITSTNGVFDLNVTAGNAAVDAANIGLTVNDGATTATDFTGLEMLLTADDADADVFGLTITGAATTNATTGSYEAGITIDNAENTASSMTDAILITSSGVSGGVVDAIDVSASNITNALNVGGNNIQLFDSAINISSVDGQLDIDADTEVEIATTTLDLNGALDVSGTSTLGGTTTISAAGGLALSNAETITNGTDGTITLTRNDSGTVTLLAADDDANAALTVSSGGTGTLTLDAGGAGAIAIGSADVTSLTVTTDSTGNAEVVLPNDSIGTAEILDDTITATNLGATLTFADSDLIDLSSVNASGTAEGLILPQAASCASATAEGQICWDTDDILYVGDGSAASAIGGVTASSTDTLTNKTLTAPKFADLGFIADASGAEMIIFDSSATPVNEITIQSADTGVGPTITTSGEAAVPFNIDTKGAAQITIGSADVTEIQLDAVALDINASGAIAIDAAASTATITNTADGAGDDMTISVAGATDSSLVLSSAGTGADALQITTSAGGIDISASGAAAGEDIDISTSASVNISSTEDAASAITLTSNAGTSETIVVTNTQGTSASAIDLTASAGGISATAAATKNITLTTSTTGRIDLAAPVLMSSTSSRSGAGALDITSSIVEITTTGADALTLADGQEGQIMYAVMITDGGDGTLTPSNFTGGSTITFDAVGDTVTLLFTNGAWFIVGQNSVAIG
jgi:hypothetical protein